MSLFRKEKVVDPQLQYADASLLASSATAGTNGAVPAQVAGYVFIQVNGVSVKLPYFNV